MTAALTVIDELSTARIALEQGPLSARTLKAVRSLRAASSQERVADGAIGYIASLILAGPRRADIRFCEVTTAADWRGVRELRRRCYPASLPYLVDVLQPDGSDRHDRHSFVYAAFLGDRALATIRATTYPYEVLDHLGEVELAGFLGANWKTEYIEWGRLLVDRGYSKMRLTPALITYAGLRLLTLTPYRSYFGYTKPQVRRMISRFAINQDTMEFQIPSRGSHHYLLTKGSLGAGVVREIPKWLRLAGGKIVRADRGVAPARAATP